MSKLLCSVLKISGWGKCPPWLLACLGLWTTYYGNCQIWDMVSRNNNTHSPRPLCSHALGLKLVSRSLNISSSCGAFSRHTVPQVTSSVTVTTTILFDWHIKKNWLPLSTGLRPCSSCAPAIPQDYGAPLVKIISDTFRTNRFNSSPFNYSSQICPPWQPHVYYTSNSDSSWAEMSTGRYPDYSHLDNFHRDNCHMDNCCLGQLPPRIIATRITATRITAT